MNAKSLHILLYLILVGTCKSFAPNSGLASRVAKPAQKQLNYPHNRVEHAFTAPTRQLQKQAGTTVRLSAIQTVAALNPDKDMMSKAYRRGSYVFATLAAILLLIPDRSMTALLASKLGGAAGYAMAAGLCHILEGANKHDRLGSDTYLRLNLGLLGFFAIGILWVPAEAGFFLRAAPAAGLSLVLTIAKAFGILLSFLGWKRGVDPNGPYDIKTLVAKLKEGSIDAIKGLRVENSKRALTYRNCLLLVVIGIVSNAMEAFFNFRYREALQRSWFEISLNGSAVSRLVMVATMIYSLKDAAERDRLTGTTFIQLNLLIGVWAFAASIGQCIFPLGFALYRGVEMFAFSLPFLLKALKYSYYKRKKELEKESGQ